MHVFGWAWLVWDAVAILLQPGEATAAVAAGAVAVMVAWRVRRVTPEQAMSSAIASACKAIVPANLCSIVFDVALRDPTSHSMAPFEMIFSLLLGSAIVAITAPILARLIPPVSPRPSQ